MPFNFKRLGKLREWRKMKRKIPELIANDGQNIWRKNFRTDSFENKAWPPLSPSTIAKKRKRKKGSTKVKALVDTSALKRALYNSIYKVRWRRIEWRVKGIPYAQYHNEGTGHVPQRQFMGANEELDKKIKRRLRKLDRLFKGTT